MQKFASIREQQIGGIVQVPLISLVVGICSSSRYFSLFFSTPISIPCLFSMLQQVSCIVPCLVAEKIEDKWGGRNVVTVQTLLFCFDNWKT